MHLTCPAKGSERQCFSRVKLLEALGATTDYYLRDTACGLLRRGGTRVVEVVCAGGAGGQSTGCQGCKPGWGDASSAGEPVLLLPWGFLSTGSRHHQRETISCSQTGDLGDAPGSQSATGFSLLVAVRDRIQWPRWCLLLLCPCMYLSCFDLFRKVKGIPAVLSGLRLTQVTWSQIFLSVG